MNIWFDGSEEENYEERFGDGMRKALREVLAEEDLDPEKAELSVSFVDKERIKELNSSFRGIDRVTDVLSFPQFESREELVSLSEATGIAELGDVVICMERAGEQAEEYGHSLEREVIYLFVHSVLHLLGYDHMEEDEKREMREKEEIVMKRLGIER